MELLKPASAQELAATLHNAAQSGHGIELLGNGSKPRAGGPIAPAGIRVSTASLDGVLQYEPKDLTVSVQAGMPYARFTEMLERDGYMVPLEPPFASGATVGGVIACNSSGPLRRLYGTARDVVIGMEFATLEGKLVQSGGMVVKNVAGLDMAKLLIGSMGTLAAITSVNFKLAPMPAGSATFLFDFPNASQAIAERDRILRGVLQPAAIDLLHRQGESQWTLAVAYFGNDALLARCRKEFPAADLLEGEPESEFWHSVATTTERFLAEHPAGCVVRTVTPLRDMAAALDRLPGTLVARAGNGVIYTHLEDAAQTADVLRQRHSLIEYGPAVETANLTYWPETDSSFPLMQQIKKMFDPNHLLNRGRLYGRI